MPSRAVTSSWCSSARFPAPSSGGCRWHKSSCLLKNPTSTQRACRGEYRSSRWVCVRENDTKLCSEHSRFYKVINCSTICSQDLLSEWESQGSRVQELNKSSSELESLIISITAPQSKTGKSGLQIFCLVPYIYTLNNHLHHCNGFPSCLCLIDVIFESMHFTEMGKASYKQLVKIHILSNVFSSIGCASFSTFA